MPVSGKKYSVARRRKKRKVKLGSWANGASSEAEILSSEELETLLVFEKLLSAEPVRTYLPERCPLSAAA